METQRENQNGCRSCFPEQCDLFKKGVCRGKEVDGEFAVVKASLSVLEGLLKKEHDGCLSR